MIPKLDQKHGMNSVMRHVKSQKMVAVLSLGGFKVTTISHVITVTWFNFAQIAGAPGEIDWHTGEYIHASEPFLDGNGVYVVSGTRW